MINIWLEDQRNSHLEVKQETYKLKEEKETNILKIFKKDNQ